MVIRNILFPVDFSDRSRATAPFVYSIAKLYNARVILVHACEAAPALPEIAYASEPDYEELETVSRNRLRQFAASELPKLSTLCLVSFGHAGEVIRSAALAHRVDMIAMPTHGYGGFRRLLLGSVTAKVLRSVDIPVWTDAHAPEPSHRAHPQPRRILVAVDLRSGSNRITEYALELARDTGAEVEVVHATDEGLTVAAAAGAQLQGILEGAALAQAVHVEQRPSMVDVLIGDPNPAIRLRDLALRRRADLMVIGRGAIRSRVDRFGAHAYDIVRESPCPVISI
ncbi:MAG TPA: universal stress protein [Bryobacteraceae bacterium]|nr:universal stress protein [Bryobacteraceae bacterium]